MGDLKEITSRDNPYIKHICRLISAASYREKCGEFTAEGLRICKDCFDNNVEVKSLIVTYDFYAKNTETVDKMSAKADALIKVTDSVFEKISDTKNPQGILAVGKIPDISAAGINLKGKYAALENVSDPSNLGAIARTAEALGIDGIILSGTGCDPFNPKALRASMGTLLRLKITVFEDFCEGIRKSGLTPFCCVVKGGEDIRKVNFPCGSVVIIGNEANGLSEQARTLGENITINMAGSAESLNAAAAAAIAMWELKK